VLYFALSGRVPFEADTLPRLFGKICHERVPRLRLRPRRLSEQLDRVIEPAMAKQREVRYASARELHTALSPLLAAALADKSEQPTRHD